MQTVLPTYIFLGVTTVVSSSVRITLIGVIALLWGCQQGAQPEAVDGAAPPPVAVTLLQVKADDIDVEYEFVGQVDASLEVEVRSRVAAVVEQIHFSEGGRVEAGELLFTLDDAPFQAALEQTLAALESAKAQKLSAQAQLNKARRDLNRVAPLTSQQVLSQNQQDDATSAVEMATAQLAVAEAAIKQAEANLQTARINLDYTRIKAPVSGTIGRLQQDRGTLVQAGGATLLVTIAQIDPIHINFGIPENSWVTLQQQLQSGELQLHTEGFSVRVKGEESLATSGKLDFQDYKIDAKSGNFAMRATLPNSTYQLFPGQFVRVVLQGGYRGAALAVPQRAVLDGPGGKYLYLAVSGEGGGLIAEQRPITLGEWVDADQGGENYWIVTSGLAPGDRVVVDGVARIFYPGAPLAATAELHEGGAKL
ncbi:efflux RND transporter periplasmic adaptor subunit [Ectothiorhodospiraceae bacterium BW-2]|nr:efflux RND transporter periplasmic adaptor subunit [Ectothiorhodospiraceae bacterium BW-2]